MYKTRNHKVSFFNPQQYEQLPIKHLSLRDYKKFITDIGRKISEDIILKKRDGFLLPRYLGILKVTKSKLNKGVFTTEKVSKFKGAQKEYNHHTLGYIYRISWMKEISVNKIIKPKYGRVSINICGILKFKPNRHSLKRPLCKILKNHERDYDEQLRICKQ